MTEFIIKVFVKDHKNVQDLHVRTSYGIVSSCVGVICNILLFAAKLIIGISVNSLSVTVDAFNNLSDAGSSIISFIGVKIAAKPADKEHPFGHGRVEYISALIVSLIVIQVGFSFFRDSIDKIRNPQDLSLQLVPVLILIMSIAVKLWLGAFYKKLGTRINSQIIMATATDSISDVFVTGATIVSLLIFHFTGINIDGVVGLIVSVVVMWAGFQIAKTTLEPLIGASADKELYESIKKMVENYPGVLGTHDLIIHNYGPKYSMGTIHVEVSKDVDVSVSHELIDKIEREISRKSEVFLVIHMDPIENGNKELTKIQEQVKTITKEIDNRLESHDIRMAEGVSEEINLYFDLVIPFEYDEEKISALKEKVVGKIVEIDSRMNCTVTIDKGYMGMR